MLAIYCRFYFVLAPSLHDGPTRRFFSFFQDRDECFSSIWSRNNFFVDYFSGENFVVLWTHISRWFHLFYHQLFIFMTVIENKVWINHLFILRYWDVIRKRQSRMTNCQMWRKHIHFILSFVLRLWFEVIGVLLLIVILVRISEKR